CVQGMRVALILDLAGAVFKRVFPEDPIVWTLFEDRRDTNKVHAGRGGHGTPKLGDCPECHAVKFEGQACPVCGWRPRPKPAAVEVMDGDLGRVERDRSVRSAQIDQQSFYQQLLWMAKANGHKPGFAY